MKDTKLKLHEIVDHLVNHTAATSTLDQKIPLEENLDKAWAIFEEKFPYYQEFHPWFQGKDQALSLKLKTAANQQYAKKDFAMAEKYYKISIQTWPDPFVRREHISVCHSNLSAVYYESNEWDKCQKSITSALTYCKDLKPTIVSKLKAREARINSSNIGFDDFDDDAPIEVPSAAPILDLEEPDDTTFISNDDLPNVTYKAELIKSYKVGGGRSVKAAEDIGPGEVLIIEKATASCLIAEEFQNRCYSCHKPLICPIPCRRCRGVSYCDTACENAGWENDGHKIECAFLGSIVHSGICQLAFRVLLRGIAEEPKIFLKNGAKPIPTKVPVFSNDYMSVLTSFQGADVIQKDAYVSYLYYSIAFTRLLVQNDVIDRSDHDLKRVSRLFFMHSLQNLLNSVCLQQTVWEKETGLINEYKPYATGMFPTVALLNHSCAPNTAMIYHGDTCYQISTRKIPMGEEITNNYGTRFTQDEKPLRKETLQERYGFDCQCIACAGDWPTFSKLRNRRYLRCPKCHEVQSGAQLRADRVDCEHCKFSLDIQTNLAGLSQCLIKKQIALEELKAGNIKTARKKATEAISELDVFIGPPDFELLEFNEAFTAICEKDLTRTMFR